MRLVWVLALAGCSFEVPGTPGGDDVTPDAPPSEVAPRLIEGGGIADAPVGGLVNVYVIDALTRQPVAGAAVAVGAISGTTDATGLFVARADGLAGKQTIVATQIGYRAELWLGAAGTNVTIPLRPAPMPTLPQANVMGTIPAVMMLPTPVMNHHRTGFVTFSASDVQLDVENAIRTAGNSSTCGPPMCAYTITTRVGTVSVMGALYDVDDKGTAPTNDDVYTSLGYGIQLGMTMVNGMAQPNRVITPLPSEQLVKVTAALTALPAGFTSTYAQIGFEPTPREVLQLGYVYGTALTLPAPSLTAFPAATYRLTGVMSNTSDYSGAVGIVYRRGQTATTISTGTWFLPPAAGTVSRTDATWTPPTDATVSGIVIRDATMDVLFVRSFDGSSSVTFPKGIALPTTPLTVRAYATRATYDVTSFSYDADAERQDGSSYTASQPVN